MPKVTKGRHPSLHESLLPGGQPAQTPHPQSTYARYIKIDRQKRIIPVYLQVARLAVLPSCPELDEPIKDAAGRAERARAGAVKKLLEIYRDQIRDGSVDDRLRAFFAEAAELRIWSEPDPIVGMQAFLGKPKRGAPKRTAARHFSLAADIQERVDAGKKVDEACLDIFERLDGTDQTLDTRTLRNIYFRETRHRIGKAAIRAEITLRENGPSQ
jgi:hypothetical protein